MGIGNNIKEYRTKANLTQKDLADKLHVSYQAVSKWENDDTEPSIETLKEMATILNCSINDLFGVEEEKPKETIKVVEKVVVEKQMLALCEECNKPIYDQNDLFRYKYKIRVGGRSGHHEERSKILCKKCNDIRLKKEEEERKLAEENRRRNIFKKRVRSFIYPIIPFVILLIVGIVNLTKANTGIGVAFLILSILSYPTFASLLLNNTFLSDMWLEVASWGVVKMPGVIMEFSLDGIIAGIALKILLWIIGILISLVAMVAATLICMVFGLFVYPVALKRNFSYER